MYLKKYNRKLFRIQQETLRIAGTAADMRDIITS